MLETKPATALAIEMPFTPVAPLPPAFSGGRTPPADAFVDGVIRLTGLHRNDRVIVVGCGHLDFLLGLNRRGVVRAGCERPDGGPLAASDDADVVWMPGRIESADLLTILARFGRHLRPGGAVVLGPGGPGRDGDPSWLRRLLFTRGFISINQLQLGDGDGDVLISARKGYVRAERAA